jgi:hypothetical protein
MKSTNTNIKTNSASSGLGAIRSATRNVSGNERNSVHTMSTLNDSKNSAKTTDSKDGLNKSSTDKNSDAGEYTQDREANFAARLASNGRDMAYIRGANFGKNGISPGAFASSSSSSLGAIPLAAPSWSGSGAVAAGNGNDSLPYGQRWERGNNGYIGGTADLSKEDLKLLEGGKGDGNFSVINSTVSSKVSWMTDNGNFLTQHLRSQVERGKSIGEVFNEVHGKNVGGNSQTLNINGNKIDDDFGKEGNKASHAVFLADLQHGQHGHMFKSDFENFKAVALASGVAADKIKVVDNWADYKAEITAAVKDADTIKERDGDKAQLGLLTGTAAHGYSFGGQGVHDPNATSGFSVRGQDIKEKQIEDLIGMADAHFNNTLMINCPCHSGGFDGKTDLLAEGKLDGIKNNDTDPTKPENNNQDKQPEKIA